MSNREAASDFTRFYLQTSARMLKVTAKMLYTNVSNFVLKLQNG